MRGASHASVWFALASCHTSSVAASAVYVARETLGIEPAWTPTLERYAKVAEEELRVWRLLETLESLSKKTNEEVFGGGPAIDYDAKRFSPVKAARPAWDENPPSESERPEMFSWAVVRRLNLDARQHLDAVRTTYTTARLAQCADALQEGVDYLAAVAALRDAEDDQSEE